jgi:nucleoid-associated protein YgaU
MAVGAGRAERVAQQREAGAFDGDAAGLAGQRQQREMRARGQGPRLLGARAHAHAVGAMARQAHAQAVAEALHQLHVEQRVVQAPAGGAEQHRLLAALVADVEQRLFAVGGVRVVHLQQERPTAAGQHAARKRIEVADHHVGQPRQLLVGMAGAVGADEQVRTGQPVGKHLLRRWRAIAEHDGATPPLGKERAAFAAGRLVLILHQNPQSIPTATLRPAAGV